MNLVFKSIQIVNFGCFCDQHSFTFARNSGLYFITGRNLVEVSLTSNGCGKSTLFNALFWVLTGKTLRTQRPGSTIESWYSRSTVRVTLDLVVNDTSYQITRTRKPNSLTLDSKVVEQGVVNDLLRLNEETLKRTIFVGQFVPLFLDLKPEQQSSLFSEALDLDKWLTASENASQQFKESEDKIKWLDVNRATLQGRMDQLTEQYDFELEREKSFAIEKKKTHSTLQNDLAAAKDKLDRAQFALREAESAHRPGEHPDSRQEELGALRARERSRAQALSSITAHLRTRQRERELNQANLDRYLSSTEVCPECGQQVEYEHIQEKLKLLQEEDSLITEFVDNAQYEHNTISREVEQLQRKIVTLEARQESSLKQQQEYNNVRRIHDAAVSKVEHLLQEIAKIKKSANPYTESCATLAAAYFSVQEQIVNVDTQLNDLHELSSIYKYWTSAFKEIRLNLIDETLQELEISANRHIQALGLDEWQIEFRTERENKSGTISHSFTTLIYPNGQTQPVPFESYSGGESQRLQLAVTTALSEILLIRAGISPNIEIFDEPTRALSREGITDLLECLRDRATELNRAIFFIDHNSLESGYFDKVITVEKGSTGSRLLEEV